MREYKFRAWDMDKEIMIPIFDSSTQKDWYLPTWKNRFIVMEYVGLKDKYNEDIYEGDIIKTYSLVPGGEELEITGKVKFTEGCFTIDNGNRAIKLWNEGTDIEIIGNIFEL